MRLWLCVFEFLLNQAVWENASLLSGGELNSYTSIHQIIIKCLQLARPWRKIEEERNNTLSSMSVQTGPITVPYNSPMYINTCANAMGIWLIAPNTERVALERQNLNCVFKQEYGATWQRRRENIPRGGNRRET